MRGLPASQGRAAAAPRAAAVAILLAVTAAGLQAHGTFSHGPDATAAGASGATLAIILTAAEGVALVVFIIVLSALRPSRQPNNPDEPELVRLRIPWWAKTLGVLLALAALVTPLAVLFTQKTRKTPPRPLPGAANPGLTSGHLKAPAASPIWPVIAGMAVAIAIVLALTVWSRRRRRQARRRPHQRTRLTQLLDSLAAGQDALTKAAASRGRRSSPATRRWSAASPPRAGHRPGRRRHPGRGADPRHQPPGWSVRTRRRADQPVPPGPVQHAADEQRRLPGGGRALDRMRADLDAIPAGLP